jgi:hypothetical protein
MTALSTGSPAFAGDDGRRIGSGAGWRPALRHATKDRTGGRAHRHPADCLSVRPNLGLLLMDPLSEVLRSVRLTGGVFLQAHFTAPWCVTANMDAGDVTPFMAAATPAQLIGYHVVLEGELLVSIGAEPPVKARAGESCCFRATTATCLRARRALRR